ncbi:MAG: hypothetical protein P1U67_07355 [Alcanivoracaceae bacterium]|nr:hypothetical protein [Alcanivoracaceae bacterium]
MRTLKKVITLTAMAAALQACGGGDPGEKLVSEPTTAAAATAIFNPALKGDGLPFPVDLLFASTPDGSINIPGKPSTFDPKNAATLATSVATPAAPFLADPQTALNTMDGFSTTAPMVVRFSAAIDDPSDATDISDNVRVFRLDSFDPGASASTLTVDAELTWGVDFVAGVTGGTTLLIQPLRPLQSSKTYVVVIQNGLKTTGGNPVSQDSTYSLLHGSYLLTPAIGAVTGQSDFVLRSDGSTPCDFTDPVSVADCTDVNTEDYTSASAIPGAEAAAVIAGNLAALETAGSYSDLYLLEQLRRITAKQLAAVQAASVVPTDVVLSYSVSTENIGAALTNANAQVSAIAATTAPNITVLNPISSWDGAGTGLPWEVVSPGADGDINTPADAQAYIYLGTLDNIVQFMDPANQNTSVWEADNSSWLGGVVPACGALNAHLVGGTANLVACNQYTPSPVTTTHSVPVIISAPNPTLLGTTCAGGDLPVAIYQHGITSNRGTLLAMADALASKCVVGVAIDMPKHGIAPNDPIFAALSNLQQGLQQPPFAGAANPSPVLERLVKVSSPADSCLAGTGVATGVDTDFYCPSGDNYVNLSNLANSRDSLRQSVVDLHSLYVALTESSGADLTAATIGTTIDTGNISFVGVSLGSIVGTTFVALHDGDLATATLNVGGGGIAKILDGSPSFEPEITKGLYDAAGLSKPGGSYEGFLIIAQAMVDSTDPINFAQALSTSSTPMLFQEVIGTPTNNTNCVLNKVGCPDQVVPNNVFGTSFGPAWGVVSSSGQTSYLANQNFITTPVALAGTDPLVQGTRFIAIAATAQAGAPINPIQLGPLGEDATYLPPLAATFNGIGLKSVGTCGAYTGTGAVSGVVRFTAGEHSSLLSPTANAAVTAQMQTQMVGFIDTAGFAIAADSYGVVANRPSDSQIDDCVPAP